LTSTAGRLKRIRQEYFLKLHFIHVPRGFFHTTSFPLKADRFPFDPSLSNVGQTPPLSCKILFIKDKIIIAKKLASGKSRLAISQTYHFNVLRELSCAYHGFSWPFLFLSSSPLA
jgi:hypothetical protein